MRNTGVRSCIEGRCNDSDDGMSIQIWSHGDLQLCLREKESQQIHNTIP